MITSCENFIAVLHLLAFQGNQLLHHFVGYLRCCCTSILPYVIIMGKTKRGLKPSSSSNAVGPKQKRQRRAKLSENHRYRMYCLSHQILNENSCYSSKHRRIIYLRKILLRIAKFRDFFNESSGENSLLNERSKTLMLQIGNKNLFDAWKKSRLRLTLWKLHWYSKSLWKYYKQKRRLSLY